MASPVSINYDIGTTLVCFEAWCGFRFLLESTNLLGVRTHDFVRTCFGIFDWIFLVFAFMYVNETPKPTSGENYSYERLALSCLMLFSSTLLKSLVTFFKVTGKSTGLVTANDSYAVPTYEVNLLSTYNVSGTAKDTRRTLHPLVTLFCYAFVLIWTVFCIIFDFKLLSSEAAIAYAPDDFISVVPWLFALFITGLVTVTSTYQKKVHIFYDTEYEISDHHSFQPADLTTSSFFLLLPDVFCLAFTFVIYRGINSYFGDMASTILALFVLLVNTWLYAALLKTFGAFFEGLLNNTLNLFQLQLMFPALLLFTESTRSFVVTNYGSHRHLLPLMDFNNTATRMVQGGDTRLMNTTDYSQSILVLGFSAMTLSTMFFSQPQAYIVVGAAINRILRDANGVKGAVFGKPDA
jgi:hypothetical protein